MNKLTCRMIQEVMNLVQYTIGYRTPDYIEGAGCIKRFPELLEKEGVKKPIVVTDPGLVKLGLIKCLLEVLDSNNIEYIVFDKVEVNPTTVNVEDGYKVYVENNCDSIIAFGGGSPMDCAKGIGARAAHPNKNIKKLLGLNKINKKIPPFFAVPTTAGTGSETTLAAVISIAETHKKSTMMDISILPKYAILDGELTTSLPAHITSTTGMDALTHAVEAYINQKYNTKVEDEMAKKAVQLIHENLVAAYKDGKNIQARQNMLMASFCAGRAFTRACVGYVHAVGHTLGSLYRVPHGLAMAVILPHVLHQFDSSAHARLAELAEVIGITTGTTSEKAEAFIQWIEDLQKELNIPVGFDMIEEKDIPQMIEWATKEAHPLYPTPEIWNENDFRKLINRITIK